MDTVAKLPRLPRETRGLSDRHVDGVEATWHCFDAIEANLKFGFHTESRTCTFSIPNFWSIVHT